MTTAAGSRMAGAYSALSDKGDISMYLPGSCADHVEWIFHHGPKFTAFPSQQVLECKDNISSKQKVKQNMKTLVFHSKRTLLLLRGPACLFLNGLWTNRQTYSETCLFKTPQQVLASSKNMLKGISGTWVLNFVLHAVKKLRHH